MKQRVRIRIDYVPISRLKEWRGNPRFMSEEQLHALAENVRKYDAVDPLIVDQDHRVVGGHQRLKVQKNFGPIKNLGLRLFH